MNTLRKHTAIIASGLAVTIGAGEMGKTVGQDTAQSYLQTSEHTRHDYKVASNMIETNIWVDMGVGAFIWLGAMGSIALGPLVEQED
jgi:hypothetical protein